VGCTRKIHWLYDGLLFCASDRPFEYALACICIYAWGFAISIPVVEIRCCSSSSTHTDHVEFIQGKGFKVFVKRYTLNTLIRRLAVLTFIISASLAIINYAFYTEVKELHDKDLSTFIILFMAASQIVALLVKIILTGRIVTSIGIKKSLLITPLVLLGLLIIIISAQYAASGSKLVFYAFGMAAIAVEVLRTTITNPVFLTVMQPLNPNARSKAHAIVKGSWIHLLFIRRSTTDHNK
jgi:hypothetical protein